MINIRKRNELSLSTIITQPFTKQNFLNPGDFISVNLSYPFTEELYDKKLKGLTNLINNKIIVSTNNHYNVVFDLTKGIPGEYKDWKFVIDYAKKHNILIKLNSLYAYTPTELELYIEKFVKTNSYGQK